MRKLYVSLARLVFVALFINSSSLQAQVGVGTTTPAASSILDLTSTTKGMLVPRMTAAQKAAVSTPDMGLLIYQTDGSAGFWFYDGTQWIPLLDTKQGWATLGNAATVDGTHFIGTTDNIPLTLKVNNQQAARIDHLLNNTYLGYQAGNTITTGTKNTFIGNTADATSATLTNATAIGYNALVSANNSLVLGGSGANLIRVGIGVPAPTEAVSLEGTASKKIWMERHTTANSAGNDLTMQSGGATSGATDKNGGNMIVSSGTSTGTGSSDVIFQTPTASVSGTTDNAPSTKLIIKGNGKVAVGNVTPNTTLDVNGDLALRGGTYAAANGVNSNIPIPSNSFIKITGPTAAFSLTGMTGGYDGKIVTIYNTTSQNMTITNDATSVAANRFYTLAAVSTIGTGSVTVQYDGTASRWVVIAFNR